VVPGIASSHRRETTFNTSTFLWRMRGLPS
jgi:hypothetical protein